jgi:hypothetical protein
MTAEEVAAPTPEPPPRNRWPLIGGAVVIAAAVIVAIVLIATHHSKSKPKINLPGPSASAVVSAGGRQLVSLLQSGANVTFHATYTVSGTAAKAGGLQGLEIWQRNGDRREDTVVSAGGHTDRTSSYVKGNTVQTCIQVDGGASNCQKSAVDPNNLLASVVSAIGNQNVVVSNSTISGRKVSCFQVANPQQLQLCATSDGIPVLISTASASYQLASLSTNVDSSVFNVP